MEERGGGRKGMKGRCFELKMKSAEWWGREGWEKKEGILHFVGSDLPTSIEVVATFVHQDKTKGKI